MKRGLGEFCGSRFACISGHCSDSQCVQCSVDNDCEQEFSCVNGECLEGAFYDKERAMLIQDSMPSYSGGKRLHIEDRKLRDEFGRHVILHGTNVVFKIDPFIPDLDSDFDPENSLTVEDIEDLQKWGVNMVRLGVTWESVERQMGVYDQAYLDKIEILINRLGEKGILTMLDAHQDLLTRFACGEGMPDFYA